MGAKAAAAIIMLLFVAALLLAGVFAAAFAIDAALTPSLGIAGAAALTAFILLILPVGWSLITLMRRPPPSPFGEGAIMALVGAFLKETPLLALLGAGLAGLAGTLLKRKK
jgi:hypothetical protein